MAKTTYSMLITFAAIFGASLAGCGGPDREWFGSPKKSLYERLGGEESIASVVADFVDRAANDARVNFARKGTDKELQATPDNVAHVRRSVTQFICANTGGPQKYAGLDMKTAHHGMTITNAQFDALAEDLVASLDRFKVTKRNKDELMKIVASTRADIVEM